MQESFLKLAFLITFQQDSHSLSKYYFLNNSNLLYREKRRTKPNVTNFNALQQARSSVKEVAFSMAPPTKILSPENQRQLLERAKDCSLKSLTQNECAFNGHEYICTPFKRLFQECIVRDQLIRIEVTDKFTNST